MIRDSATLSPAASAPSHRRLGAAGLLGLLLTWWLITAAGWVEPLFLPSPGQVLAALWRLHRQGYMGSSLGSHVLASLQRLLAALLASLASALTLGLAMGLLPRLRAVIDPWVELVRPLPPLAYLPLIVIWFGIGEPAKILLIYLSMFPPLLVATISGVTRIEPARLQAVRSLGANRWQLIRWVILPGAAPPLLTGLRISLGIGWSCLVAAELVATSRGLGFMIQSAAQFLATDIVLAGIVLIAVFALGGEWGLRWLQHRYIHWN
ncbi:ABC transporter permease subunit [Frateuria aurantia]|uniref:ABC-type nitrate/sulfonate/bicarbonate transport system, permease component n=1 Tax=Frateuria aurantia (strain ATCC 33424 / DSM 6220 / KCTC 2777 / LMG 1558 / NBRC 3245 / NCIMB 13370) TaxID=767434 RepID=H8L460_FRAAD|nr:ABC transporter permease subunit [Frateuria aurantia]AFC86536.1 ABC-type nitrate/sulfonate/bicarbonate transport system, permease component [Frateuria aurantia DSM 6220]